MDYASPFQQKFTNARITLRDSNVPKNSLKMSELANTIFCQTCGSETSYKCLTCIYPVGNKSANCSISAPEETPGWKAGCSVAFCCSCEAASAT